MAEEFNHDDGRDIRSDWFEPEEFVSVERIPEKFRHIYSNYLCFNRIQSSVFNDVFETDASLVVSAPTGSGKTVVFELAITRIMRKYDLQQMDYSFMVLYVAPIKALCEERMLDWHKKFSSLGINCISVTGDSDIVSVQHLSNHNLIITTPEKWDSLTRRWRNNIGFMNRVCLFMIDEVHLLNDEGRGPTLEAIMSRMKTIEDSKKDAVSAEIHQTIRFLAISATIPNVEDVAEWIGTRAMPAKYFNFSDEARPVKLMKIVQGYYFNPQMSTPFKFDIMLSYKLQGIILQYSNGKPTLIFCSTRKSVEMTSKHLSQNLTIALNGTQKSILREAAAQITTPGIKEILIHGVGSHHAGMLPESRRIVETLFRNGDLPILVTTSTLAMGINLPAHLVIIKSTKYYTKGEYKDYSESVLLQMIGRAGRPQFDTFATAVILTTTADKAKFENMIGGTQCIESSMHKHLTEHLNAEIVLRTITETGIAKQWLMSTFLHIRARKHPTYYGLSANLNEEQLDKKIMEMCQIEINKLERVGMIVIENSTILPTEMGSLMAKFCVHFETMKLFKEVQGTEILPQILSLISKCHEFSDLYLRVNDKKTLNLLNKCKNRETIRFPFSGKIKTLDMKINCIIQAVFGCLQILEPSLVNEAQKIMRIGERISKCLADYLETKGNCFSALLNALILAKCFHCRIWENSPYVSRQLTGIGAVMSTHLVQAGKISFQSILETNPRNLEMIIHRKPPMGDSIITAVEQLPKYTLTMEEVKISSTATRVKIVIKLLNCDKLEHQLTIDPQSFMSLVVGDDMNNILLYEKLSHSFLIDNQTIEKELPHEFKKQTSIEAHFISENWVGIDCTYTLHLFAKPEEKTKKTPTSIKKVKQSKKLEQIVKTVDTPYVKNYINQYFNIVKNIAAQSKAQQSHIPEKSTASSKSDFDEIDLLEPDDQELSNWEPLDERLLDSPDEQEISAVIDVIESEATYNDANKIHPIENKLNSPIQEQPEENLIEQNVVIDIQSKPIEAENNNKSSTETNVKEIENQCEAPNEKLNKPKNKFQFKKKSASIKNIVQLKHNKDFFSDELINELESLQSNITSTAEISTKRKQEKPAHTPNIQFNEITQTINQDSIHDIKNTEHSIKHDLKQNQKQLDSSILDDRSDNLKLNTLQTLERNVEQNSNSSIENTKNVTISSYFVPQYQKYDFSATLNNTSLIEPQKEILNTRTIPTVKESSYSVQNDKNSNFSANITHQNTDQLNTTSKFQTDCSNSNNNKSSITPVIENLRKLITNKNNEFRKAQIERSLPNNAFNSTSEEGSEDLEESVSSASYSVPRKRSHSPEKRAKTFINDIRDLNMPQYQKRGNGNEHKSKPLTQDQFHLSQTNRSSNYLQPSFSSETYGNSSTQRKECYTNMNRKAINFNYSKDDRLVEPENTQELGMRSFSNLFTMSKPNKRPLVNPMRFEQAIQANSPTKKLDLAKFSYTPKKRYPHTITSHSEVDISTDEVPLKRKNTNEFDYASQSNCDKKSIKWRNPLIVSPKMKHSPKKFNRGINNIRSDRFENYQHTEVLSPSQNLRQQTNVSLSSNSKQPQPNQFYFGQDLHSRRNVPPSQHQAYQNLPSEPQRRQIIRPPTPRYLKRPNMFSSQSNFALKIPQNVCKFPVTDQDCGYSQSTQRVQDTERKCDELNNFFSSSKDFKPETRGMNFIESDIATYVGLKQPEIVPANPNEEQDWWNQEEIINSDDATGEEWWNQPEDNEDIVKEQLQQEIKEMFQSTNPNQDFQYSDPRSFRNQCRCCNHYSHRNPLQTYNYQNTWPNVEDTYCNTVPPMYHQMNPMWNGANGRNPEVNHNTWPGMVDVQNYNPERNRYNNVYKSDLIEQYLNSQSQNNYFKNK